MSDFNLLGFLNIAVPNEPATAINQQKENFKILTPVKKADDRASGSTPKTPERLQEDVAKPKQSPNQYFRTTYGDFYGSASPESPTAPTEEAPLTPNSVSSVSTISSTISVCEDPECDSCLLKKQQDVLKALAAHERDMEKTEFENKKKQIEQEIQDEQKAEAARREKEKNDLATDKERLRIEREAQRIQKQKEDADEAAMLKALSVVDHSAIDAANARNEQYRGELYQQIVNDNARKNEQKEKYRTDLNEVGGATLVFGGDEEVRQARLEGEKKDVLRTLAQQITDRENNNRALQELELEEHRRNLEEQEAAYQAKRAAELEKQGKIKEGFVTGNKAIKEDKIARGSEITAQDNAFDNAQNEQRRIEEVEEKRKADEKKRAELIALHHQLADQVARRREAQRKQREDEKAFGPHAGPPPKKATLIHCVDCEEDLPPERFSNYVVAQNGKVYKKSKALPKNSPLHKYLHKSNAAETFDFQHI